MASRNLVERWTRLISRALPEVDGRGAFARVAQAYSTPPRAYHNLDHIGACLSVLDGCGVLPRNSEAVELALWFHDVIYDPRANDNELRSAEWAREFIVEGGAGPGLASEVGRLVLKTRHGMDPAVTDDEKLVVDIDLSILGEAPEVFDRYEVAVREEYRWVPWFLYRRKRAQVLEGFLQSDSIYRLPAFVDQYEAAARRNLERSLGRLGR